MRLAGLAVAAAAALFFTSTGARAVEIDRGVPVEDGIPIQNAVYHTDGTTQTPVEEVRWGRGRSSYWGGCCPSYGYAPRGSYYWGGVQPYRSHYWGTYPYRSYYWGGHPYRSYYSGGRGFGWRW